MINRYCLFNILLAFLSLVVISCDKTPLPALDPSSYKNANFIKIPIKAQNVSYESVRTDNRFYYEDFNYYKHYINTKTVLGDYKDDAFGEIKTEFYTQLILPSNNFSFGDISKIEIDSAYLILEYVSDKIDSTFYGDTSSAFTFSVNELSEDLKDTNVPYFSNKKLNYSLTELSENEQIYIKPDEKISIPNFENGKPAASKEVDGHIRIKLSNDFILNKFLLASNDNLSSQDKFASYFKGFKISMNKKSQQGGLLNINTGYSDRNICRLVIYYHENLSDGKYYHVVEFPIATATTYAKGLFYSYIDNKPHENAIADSNNLYLLPLAGIKAKLDLSELYNNLAFYKNNIVINSAKLTANLHSNYYDKNNIPTRLTINRGLSKEGNIINLPDGNLHDNRPINNLDDNLRKDLHLYSFNLQKTAYDLLQNNLSSNSLYIDLLNTENSIYRVMLLNDMYLEITYNIVE